MSSNNTNDNQNNQSNLNSTKNSSNQNESNNNSDNNFVINNPELENIKIKDKNSLNSEKPEKMFPKIEIPERNNNYYEDSEDLIDLSNEIEMITDELKETYYDDLLNKQDMSLLKQFNLFHRRFTCITYWINFYSNCKIL